ncbi:FAD-dependent oxidoreductase [Desulfallas sp. Bu1-1]|uniref:oxidoreductase n=1 Tax=Desulfallas sp. Bu1-1 TaxID=2787620 RepID=UPI00189D73CF|nr:FAD-dependent oxidoreductase [Desulfallas sp. Bu1-1]MBF7084314.1 FAD-dependent oxidoreductase [Desulfallas sp. Bu1-1]
MSKLYSPGKIGTLEIRNRFVMTAMGLAYCPGGEISDRLVEFFRYRARGGVGLIVLGAVGIDPLRKIDHDMVYMHDDSFIPGLRRLTDAVHAEGAKIFAQLFHAGRYARTKEYYGVPAVAPSAVPSKFTGETPQELTQSEITEIISFFAEGARRAKEAGFDGVEIIGNSGYLIGQFLSPLTNKRTDRYGGDLQARMTFPLEVIDKVRQTVGPDYPVMVRVGGNDFMPGGNTNVEARQFCVAAEKAGVDAISVTGGWHETQVPQLTMEVPPGAYSYLAKAIKESVSIPVVACNRMNAKLGEKIVDEGIADFIGMARPFIADAELAAKAEKGEYETIRPCVACNQGCLDNIFHHKSVECLANAEAGREAELLKGSLLPLQIKSDHPEKILVIGAGVAGLEYARVAATRGHQVTIWEENTQPGGQVLVASAPPGRQDFLRLKDYLVNACRSLNIEICFGKKATADNVLAEVKAGVFDRVVVATGAKPIAPPIPVEEGVLVVQAWDVLKNQAKTGSNVVIVGGGAVGVETALYLAEIGTIDASTLRHLMIYQAEKPEELYRLLTQGIKHITVVEMVKGIGKDIGPSSRWSMLALLRKFNVKTMDQTKVVAIKQDGVLVETAQGQELIPADTVVLAVGSRSDNKLYEELKGQIDKLVLIGDARKPRKMLDAIREAYDEAIKN